MKKFLMFGFAVLASTFVSKQAFAHSDYWRCAASAGSPENAIRLCGVRGGHIYDRDGNVRGGGWDRGGYGRGPGPGFPGGGGWGRGPGRGPGPGYPPPGGGWGRGPGRGPGPGHPGGGWGRGPGRGPRW